MPRPAGKGRRARGPELAQINDPAARRVCFSKRRRGLFSKADALRAARPGTQLVAVVFSECGHPFASSSSGGGAAPPDAFVCWFLGELLHRRRGREEVLDGAEADPRRSSTNSRAVCSSGCFELHDLEEGQEAASDELVDDFWAPPLANSSPAIPSCTAPLLPVPPHLPISMPPPPPPPPPGPKHSASGRSHPSIGAAVPPPGELGFRDADDDVGWCLAALEHELLGLGQGLL